MLHRKRILFAINSLAGGGAERVLATLLAGSEPWRARYDIHLALLDDEPRAYDVPEWVELHQLDAGHKLLPSLTGLRALAGRLKPHATLSFLTRANIANAWAMAGRRRPWLISERVNTSAHLGSAVAARAMVRLVYPRAAHVIAVSEGVVDDLAAHFGVARSRMSAIANPVDHRRIAELAAEPPAFVPAGPYIAAAGRLVPNKNFPLLLRAYAQAAPPERLVILGEGPERGALEALAASLGIACPSSPPIAPPARPRFWPTGRARRSAAGSMSMPARWCRPMMCRPLLPPCAGYSPSRTVANAASTRAPARLPMASNGPRRIIGRGSRRRSPRPAQGPNSKILQHPVRE